MARIASRSSPFQIDQSQVDNTATDQYNVLLEELRKFFFQRTSVRHSVT